MDLETAIQAFGSAGHDLPREAMQWTLDHWDEAAPGLLRMLERYPAVRIGRVTPRGLSSSSSTSRASGRTRACSRSCAAVSVVWAAPSSVGLKG